MTYVQLLVLSCMDKIETRPYPIKPGELGRLQGKNTHTSQTLGFEAGLSNSLRAIFFVTNFLRGYLKPSSPDYD